MNSYYDKKPSQRILHWFLDVILILLWIGIGTGIISLGYKYLSN